MPMQVCHRTAGRLATPSPNPMTQMLWLVAALVLLPCGWFAAAWRYKRQLGALQEQLQAVRRTAAEHAQQARRQMGQLQAELAARQPLPVAERELRDAAATDPAPSGARAEAGFASTVARSDGFPQTVLVRPPPKRR
ncbi:MAG: hypothetical protein IPO59_19035 [Betaproteobacteria bacterium]|nr:hypothetical protein [Betaproteobacteria bacterium]